MIAGERDEVADDKFGYDPVIYFELTTVPVDARIIVRSLPVPLS